MGERRGMKALELWCKRVTDGYQGVKVENMTTSWRDGLAFCAIIHHFRPDLIDFGSLKKADIYRNNELAYRTAEIHLGIPALLDAEDMVECSMPDRLSILTYLSQFYQTFAGSRQSTSPNRVPTAGKRPASPSILSPNAQTPPTKMASLGPARREPCAKCRLPVFLAERLLVGGRTLYHRTCFRCARCQHQLSVANCYETEDGQFCCETCPDEVEKKQEGSPSTVHSVDTEDAPKIVPEKDDTYGADFDSVLENSSEDRSVNNSNIDQDVKSTARADFMIGQLLWEDQEVTNPYPPLSSANSGVQTTDRKEHGDRTRSSDLVSSSLVNISDASEALHDSDNSNSVVVSSYFSTKTDSLWVENAQEVVEQVPVVNCSSINSSDNQPSTANDRPKDCVEDQNKFITTCTKESDSPPTSLVKMRMKMFDTHRSSTVQDKTSNITVDRKSLDSNVETEDGLKSEPELVNTTSVSESKSMDCAFLEGDDTTIISEAESLVVSVISTNKVETSAVVDKVQSEEKDNDSIIECEETKIVPDVSDVIEPASCIISSINEVQDLGSSDSDVIASTLVKPNEIDFADNQIYVHDNSGIQNTLRADNILRTDSRDTRSGKTGNLASSSEKRQEEEYPLDLNPFGDDERESESEEIASNQDFTHTQASSNPFGSSDDEEEKQATSPKKSLAGKPPRPPQPVSRQSLTLHPDTRGIASVLSTPRQSATLGSKAASDARATSLNPFWSEGEEPSSEEEKETLPKRTPVPLPRSNKNIPSSDPNPMPRLNRSSGQFGSATSLSSTGSSANSTIRTKKKTAPPPPPPPMSTHPDLAAPPETTTPSPSTTSSPRTVPRHRKARPAPAPPDPVVDFDVSGRKREESSVECEREKSEKDEANRTVQSRRLIVPTEEQSAAMIAPNKSTYGQWKRKKGPAPPRPVPPQRRVIQAMPMKEVKRELGDIDVQQLELERQGVSLEKNIRSKFEQTESIDESGVTPDVEDLVLQLFEIVNEKNELFRRQAELMYLRRQHRLEEEHADLEYEIRCLLVRPEHTKTDSDKAYEEELIQRLVDVVERRNEIVNCLEMDRQREVEEDRSIHNQLASFAAKGKEDIDSKEEVEARGSASPSHKKTLKLLKKKMKKSKEKHSKKKEKTGVDSDKDIDESDPAKVLKEKKLKKKWF